MLLTVSSFEIDDKVVVETEVKVGLGAILLCCESKTGDCCSFDEGGVSGRFACGADIGYGEVKTGVWLKILGAG